MRFGRRRRRFDNAGTCVAGGTGQGLRAGAARHAGAHRAAGELHALLRRRRDRDLQRLGQALLRVVRAAALRGAARRQHLEPRHLGAAGARDFGRPGSRASARVRRCTRISARALPEPHPRHSVHGDLRRSQPAVAMSFLYADESDPGPYPGPVPRPGRRRREPAEQGQGRRARAARAGGHLPARRGLRVRRARATDRGRGGSGAVFDLASNALRTDTWTSADAAGLPILPGLVRYDEVAAGEITHALRFTAPATQRAYVWPARHFASSDDRSRASADGHPRPAQGLGRHLRLLDRQPGDPDGPQDLRHDARRQRFAVVRLRRSRPPLGRRRPARAADACTAATSKSSTSRR